MSAPPMHAAAEIDQTIRLARHRVESQIARYRIWFFALALAMTTLANWMRYQKSEPPDWYSPAWFALCLGYALGVRAAVARWGRRRAVGRVALCVDLVLSVANFLLVPEPLRASVAPWALLIAPAALLVVLVIN
ncbi:MAG TPA: hypothetical protein VK447_02820, partial [Myxococcaceae bacterium]|nr:hypothetical protein [Myxococcaceae bacterium]